MVSGMVGGMAGGMVGGMVGGTAGGMVFFALQHFTTKRVRFVVRQTEAAGRQADRQVQIEFKI